MPQAALYLPASPHYGLEAFEAGFRAVGYEPVRCWGGGQHQVRFDAGDVIVVWNRQPATAAAVREAERRGARVMVAENAYIGSREKGDIYALAMNAHNGAGYWWQGDYDRWSRFGVELAPWRERGDHVLVLPQRSIGLPPVQMPHDWVEDVRERLRRVTTRPVVVRPHPGINRYDAERSLQEDLRNAHCAVTWGSGAAIKALAAGVPVFHEFDNWIGRQAARFGIADIENVWMGDRMPMFHRLAWAQWRRAEVATGEPFRHLLQ